MSLFVLYKDLMAQHVTSVNLLTLPCDGQLVSCIISSLVSVSASENDIPILGFSLKEGSELETKFQIGDEAFVSLLSDSQIEVAQHFAKFREGDSELFRLSGDSLDFKEIVGYFKIKLTHKIGFKTSKFFFCEVIKVQITDVELNPLSYYKRNFNGLTRF